MKLDECQKITEAYETLVAGAYAALHSGNLEDYTRLSDDAVRLLPDAANAYWFKEHPLVLPEYHKDPAWVPPTDLHLDHYCGGCRVRRDYHCLRFIPGPDPLFCVQCRVGVGRHCLGFWPKGRPK